jgi:hypothetical protein
MHNIESFCHLGTTQNWAQDKHSYPPIGSKALFTCYLEIISWWGAISLGLNWKSGWPGKPGFTSSLRSTSILVAKSPCSKSRQVMKWSTTKAIYLIEDIIHFKSTRIVPCKSVQILLSCSSLIYQPCTMNASTDCADSEKLWSKHIRFLGSWVNSLHENSPNTCRGFVVSS